MKVTSQTCSSTCFTPHLLSRKHLIDVDFAPLIAEAPAGRDDRRPVVRRILKLFQPFIGPRGRLIAAGQRLHLQRLMRPFVVVALHEGVEAGLLLEDVRGRGVRRLRLERQVQPFMPAVLLGIPTLQDLLKRILRSGQPICLNMWSSSIR